MMIRPKIYSLVLCVCACVSGAVNAMELDTNAITHTFINGYDSEYRDVVMGGVHYDKINYRLIKLRNKDEYLNKVSMDRDETNHYSVSYLTDGDHLADRKSVV